MLLVAKCLLWVMKALLILKPFLLATGLYETALLPVQLQLRFRAMHWEVPNLLWNLLSASLVEEVQRSANFLSEYSPQACGRQGDACGCSWRCRSCDWYEYAQAGEQTSCFWHVCYPSLLSPAVAREQTSCSSHAVWVLQAGRALLWRACQLHAVLLQLQQSDWKLSPKLFQRNQAKQLCEMLLSYPFAEWVREASL